MQSQRIILTVVAAVSLTLFGSISQAEEVLVADPLEGTTVGQQVGTGEFQESGGWKSTGGKIVFDAGRIVDDGYFEVKMRGWTAPAQGIDKSHPLSGWEVQGQYTHHAQEGSYWNWRIGTNYGSTAQFPQPFKVLASPLGLTPRQEMRVGDKDAVNDGNPHTYRVEWKEGTVRFLFDGTELVSWSFERFQLRYFTVGKDDLYGITDPAPVISELRIVDRANRPPAVDFPDHYSAEDEVLFIPRESLTGYIADPDDDFDDLDITFGGDQTHWEWSFDQETGLSLQPQPEHWNGEFGIEVTATDPEGLSDSDAFLVTVHPVNDPPGPFDLLSPPDGTQFVGGLVYAPGIPKPQSPAAHMVFYWSPSENLDEMNGDSVEYAFYFGETIDPSNAEPIADGLGDTVYTYLQFDTLTAGTYMWTVEASDDSGASVLSNQAWSVIIPSTGLDPTGGGNLPTENRLMQNYPNPFNGVTTIRFSLLRRSKVIIAVYDALSREIRTLSDEVRDAGSWAVTWDGKDQYGRGVSSGIYIVRIHIDTWVDTKKLLYIR